MVVCLSSQLCGKHINRRIIVQVSPGLNVRPIQKISKEKGLWMSLMWYSTCQTSVRSCIWWPQNSNYYSNMLLLLMVVEKRQKCLLFRAYRICNFLSLPSPMEYLTSGRSMKALRPTGRCLDSSPLPCQ
jgi:hypothetical protein